MIDFVKAHGTGNDFVVIGDFDSALELSADSVRRICDRHCGIGADGVIRITRSDAGTFFMDYRNADGSVAEMCGNGVRVVGKWLGDRTFARELLALETRSGLKQLELHRGPNGTVDEVTVDMGPPVGEIAHETIAVGSSSIDVTIVSMGNPHAVVFVDDVDAFPLDAVGPALATHDRFAEGTNVEVVDGSGPQLRQRTWERGVGETLACGTGACAVAVAAHSAGRSGTTTDIELRGGRLQLQWVPGASVMMTGPAVEVFSASLDPGQFGITIR